jgi:hypothetical protein
MVKAWSKFQGNYLTASRGTLLGSSVSQSVGIPFGPAATHRLRLRFLPVADNPVSSRSSQSETASTSLQQLLPLQPAPPASIEAATPPWLLLPLRRLPLRLLLPLMPLLPHPPHWPLHPVCSNATSSHARGGSSGMCGQAGSEGQCNIRHLPTSAWWCLLTVCSV